MLYSDPVIVTDKASSVLSVLGSESNLRDCEIWPDFSYHDEILANFEEGVGWILCEIEADRQTLSVNVRGTTLSPRSTVGES